MIIKINKRVDKNKKLEKYKIFYYRRTNKQKKISQMVVIVRLTY